MAEKMRVAIYCRLAREDADTMETQKERVLRFAAEHGHHDAAVYLDDGASGMNFNRAGFARMGADIQAGMIDAVYVQSLSRLGRNIFDLTDWLEGMQKKGITVKAADGSLDTDLRELPGATFLETLRKYRKGGKRHGA
jgi:DNA invertase Pin-like site-specific DNA recombinase